MRRIALAFALIATSAASFAAAPETELRDETGKIIIKYVVEPPAHLDPTKPLGLFLCFPEHDNAVGSDIFPVRQALIRMGIRDQFVLLAGGPQAQKMGPADIVPIEKLIAWAKKTYPINPRRVYMFGKGEGGKISAEFTMLHPSVVTAAITYSWGFWVMPSEITDSLDPEAAPEIYMNLGLRDLATHLTTVRDTYPRVKAKGYNVIYREFEDMGSRSYYPASNDDAIAWAVRLRNKNIPPSDAENKLLKSPAIGPSGYFSDLVSVGGAPAGAALQKLFGSKDANIRAAAAETCSNGSFGEATISALAKLANDPSAKVRQAAVRALGVSANWRSQAAQRALIELATNPAAGADDRVAATDALGYAVRLQIRGVRQDPPMFAALVSLLTDKEEEVRAMATAILAPAYQIGDATPPRKAPEGGWQKWLEEIAAREAGYLKDYEVCQSNPSEERIALYCKGGSAILGYDVATGQPGKRDSQTGYKLTLQAAELGYVPAQAAVAMLIGNGKGTQQDYAESRKWWAKASAGGHPLAMANVGAGRGAPRAPARIP